MRWTGAVDAGGGRGRWMRAGDVRGTRKGATQSSASRVFVLIDVQSHMYLSVQVRVDIYRRRDRQ